MTDTFSSPSEASSAQNESDAQNASGSLAEAESFKATANEAFKGMVELKQSAEL